MAIPIIKDWDKYFSNPHEGMGSSYERIILNKLLFRIADEYGILSALETPAFGFTGLSGINLLGLAKQGISISLEDHDEARLEKIKALWQNLAQNLQICVNKDYSKLDYPTNSFDLGFNFSALWFVADLRAFLSELSRCCKKAILLCVPNRSGLGYKMQIQDYTADKFPDLHPENIDPALVRFLMKKNGWYLKEKGFIDCPPWPDIGMNKELWLNKVLGKKTPESATPTKPVSILPYYQGSDPDFERRMLSLSFIESFAPDIFKQIWAHHYFMLFLPDRPQ